jgi:hypothetical protein
VVDCWGGIPHRGSIIILFSKTPFVENILYQGRFKDIFIIVALSD